jgi:alpha-mannosidase
MCVVASQAAGHDVYLMNSNHTDYNWNATTAQYDAAMLAELDYYLQQIADTSGSPPEEQARYVPDNWWFLWLYEHDRTAEQFDRLIDAIRSGYITIPLNPFVILYGALPTEAAIRAGYYPGRIARRYGLEFLLAENIENHTNPWGIASLWAGSGVRYTWKGVCGCADQQAPDRSDEELFIWQGPDDKILLFKWYNLLGSYKDWGGYSEARNIVDGASSIDTQIARTQSRMPGIGLTGMFGAGWDDVDWQSTGVVDKVVAYNDLGTGDRALVSNGIDFFRALESSGAAATLATLRGGWGNDWDMWAASLAERTSRVRRALELLRTAEALAVTAELHDPGTWPPVRGSLESGLISVWKFFEHSWNVTGGGPTLAQMKADKEAWAQDIENAVSGAIAGADATIVVLFDTPNEDRVAVFNPLGFTRTDVAKIEVTGPGPYVVLDVASGLEVPSQLISDGAQTMLQFLASDVPSLGYRVYRYAAGTPSAWPAAATVTPGSRTIESDLYRVVLGTRGQITEATHKVPEPDVQLAGANGMNDFGSGAFASFTAENVGPVSATLRVDLSDPARTVRVRLVTGVDRIEIDNVITQNVTGLQTYSFHTNLPGAQIRFEEIGAIARPGLVTEGGDFLQGARANRMTLNHFVSFDLEDYHLVLSNRDAYAMQVNDSTNATFDLTGDEVHVVVMEQQTPGAGTADQGGDDLFRNRFAVRGEDGPFDGAEAMRFSFAHQNPLHSVVLPRNQTGPLTAATAGLLSIDADNVVVTAFKPAEDEGGGWVVRLWELGGQPTSVSIDASAVSADGAWHTSLIESDIAPVPVAAGTVSTSINANEIKTFRFGDGVESGLIFADSFESGDPSGWSSLFQ